MQELIMTLGLPGSGKSTWANQYIKDNPGAMRINKDDLRKMLHAGKHSKMNEKYVLDYRDALVSLGLSAGKTVVVDDTNFAPRHKEKLSQLAKEHEVPLIVVSFTHIPLETCIRNDLRRDASVGKDVIMKMWKQYLAPKPVESPKYDPKLPNAVICDLDGTLAHMTNRGPFEQEKCESDRVDEPVANLVRLLKNAGKMIIYTSGRNEAAREQTKKWLISNDLYWSTNDILLMREPDDIRKDSIVKEEIYHKYIEGKYNVDFVLDDRNQVVEMWRNLGLKCLQVAEGDF